MLPTEAENAQTWQLQLNSCWNNNNNGNSDINQSINSHSIIIYSRSHSREKEDRRRSDLYYGPEAQDRKHWKRKLSLDKNDSDSDYSSTQLTMCVDQDNTSSTSPRQVVLSRSNSKISQTETKVVLDELGLDRYCCRRHMLGHVDIIDDLWSYSLLLL